MPTLQVVHATAAWLRILTAIAADRFDRTAFHCLFAKRFFLRTFRLLINVGMAAVIIALEIGRLGFAAQIAVDALIIHVKLTLNVFGVFVSGVGHNSR